jgi:hypothetical protein
MNFRFGTALEILHDVGGKMAKLNSKVVVAGLVVVLVPLYLMLIISGVVKIGNVYLSDPPEFSVFVGLWAFAGWSSLMYIASFVTSMIDRSLYPKDATFHAIVIWAFASIIVGLGLFFIDRFTGTLLRAINFPISLMIALGSAMSLWISIKGGAHGWTPKSLEHKAVHGNQKAV